MPLVGDVTAIYINGLAVSRTYLNGAIAWDAAGVVLPGLLPSESLFPSVSLFPDGGSASLLLAGVYGSGFYGSGFYGGD